METGSAFFAYTDGDQWRFGIGDPSLMGWVTVAAYFVAAALSFKVASQAARLENGWRSREALFWLVLFGGMALLGVNKQLDLQTWLTLTVRRWSRVQGWYEYRRPLQVLFVLFVFAGSVAACRMLFELTRGKLRQNSLALAGMLFVAAFVVVRASSFHHVDLFLKSAIGGVKMNWAIELTGIGLVIANALWRWKAEGASRGAGESGFILVRGGPERIGVDDRK